MKFGVRIGVVAWLMPIFFEFAKSNLNRNNSNFVLNWPVFGKE